MPVTSPPPDTGGVSAAAKPAEVRHFDEDAAYIRALKEIESGTVEQAIWSRAFADAEGVDAKARALYIKLRVERMRKTT